MDRLDQQINFLVEADKLKSVERRTRLIDDSRHENSAEHTWHLLLAAVVLREYTTAEIDLLRVMELIAMHDLVEIDAGDTFAYDHAGQTTKAEREHAAAERIFGLLPEDQQSYFHTLWHEFEAKRTPEARFANALDRFQPLLLNAHSEGGSWKQLKLTRDDVLRRMGPIESAMPDLWPTVVRVVDAFCVAGVLRSIK